MAILWLKISMLALTMHTMISPWESKIVIIAGYAMILGTWLYAVAGTNFRKVNAKVLLVMWICFYSIICMIIGNPKTPSALFQSIIAISCFLLCFLRRAEEYRSKDLKFIFDCNLVHAITFAVYTYVPFSFRYTTVNEYGYRAFTMNMGNSNATSISVMFVMILLLIEVYVTQSKTRKWTNILCTLLLTRTLLLLGSRNSIVCVALFMLLAFLYRHGKKFGMLCFWGAVSFSTLSIVVHLVLSQMGEILVFGKSLATGRGVMFEEILNNIQNNPLQFILGRPDLYGFGNYHNGPLSIFCSIGIVGTVFYYAVWKQGMKQICKKSENNTLSALAYFAILSFIVNSGSEAAALMGGVPFSVEIMVLLCIGKGVLKKETTPDTK